MNTLNRVRDSVQGAGRLLLDNPIAQEVLNYGAGAALGAGGQQLMNWTTPGADPNPLLSGLLSAPIGATLFRGGAPTGAIAQAALNASKIGSYGGMATSLYNVATDGADYDNNLVAAGAGTLGAIAPIAYSLLRGKGKSSAPKPNARPNRPSSSNAPSTANYYETPSPSYPYNASVQPFRRG